jgi:hypothetical protein
LLHLVVYNVSTSYCTWVSVNQGYELVAGGPRKTLKFI